jgi:predicted RNA binding protein YcfA (HicA-like mRNA interferase family)
MARDSTGRLEALSHELPHLFDPPYVPAEVFDDFVVVPIDKVESIPPSQRTDAFAGRRDKQGDDSVDAEITAETLEEAIAETLDQYTSGEGALEGLAEKITGTNPGGPLARGRLPSPMPPPDCLAFYLPFHYFLPTWWGVYLTVEGVAILAAKLVLLSRNSLTPAEAIAAARIFLYHHEAFHHHVECFATRLELTHRQRLYAAGFNNFYSRTFGTDACVEEGLANAQAYRKTKALVGGLPIDTALQHCIAGMPPGYRLGVSLAKRFRSNRAKFAEDNHVACFPTQPVGSARIWDSLGHMFDGISNIRGRVNYIVSRNAPLVSRARVRPLLPPSKLVKKLAEYGVFDFVRHGADHDIYRAGNGAMVPIPRHPRDMRKSTVKKILREAGVQLSLSEFVAK